MEAYSLDLRERVLAACDGGKKTKEVADLFGVSRSWIRWLKKRRRETGQVDRLPQNPGRKPKLTEMHRQRLAELVAEQPDATLNELRDRLGVSVNPTTIFRVLRKMELTLKKNPCTPPSRTART
jgi:transposase